MKIKFNQFERVAGLFVLSAFGGTIAFALAIAIQQGFFESKAHLQTMLETADGVREGTAITMQGLRIGQVTSVELVSANEVRVHFKMKKKYLDKVRADSVVRAIRPFIIGEKVLDVSIGSQTAEPASELALLKSVPTTDIMDLMSGKTLGPYMEMMGRVAENLKFVAESFADPKRTQAMVGMFDELSPLLKNANALLVGVNKDKQLITVVKNLVSITNEVNRALPEVAKQSPEMLAHLSKIARNMAVLTDEIQKTMPVMQKLAPEIPRASERAMQALDETVVTLKALQKSFILRGSANEVRAEEAAARKKQEDARVPAAEKEN